MAQPGSNPEHSHVGAKVWHLQGPVGAASAQP